MMVGRRYSDGATGTPSATRILHAMLWFVTGFCLSSVLLYTRSTNVSKVVVSSNMGNAQYQVKYDAQQAGQMTRVFLYEQETGQGNNFPQSQKNLSQQTQQQQSAKQQSIDSHIQKSEKGGVEQKNIINQNQESSDSVGRMGRLHSPTGVELEVLLQLDKELKVGLSDIGQEIVDEEMFQDSKNQIQNAYPRYTTAWDVMDRQTCFLFIGVLTSANKYTQREALREAWVFDANKMADVVVRFVMFESEFSIQMEQEVNDNGDFLFVQQSRRQKRFDLNRVYRMFEYVAERYQASFVLKTDDAAYVNVPVLIKYLQNQCENENCLHERLYIGYEQNNSPVMRDTSQSAFKQWINQKYYEVIKSDVYIPYMMGGGYILSGDLVEILVSTHRNIGLFWSPIEDATVGMWLAGLNIRRVTDQHSFLTQDFDCCFYEFPDMPWHPWIGYNRLVVDVCKTDTPRLILHSISNSTFMKTLGWRVRRCDFTAIYQHTTT